MFLLFWNTYSSLIHIVQAVLWNKFNTDEILWNTEILMNTLRKKMSYKCLFVFLKEFFTFHQRILWFLLCFKAHANFCSYSGLESLQLCCERVSRGTVLLIWRMKKTYVVLILLILWGWLFYVETLQDYVMHRVSLYFRSQTFYPPSAQHPLFQSLSAAETQRGL